MPAMPDDRAPILFRVDPETKEWLELLAAASGFGSLQDYMEAVARKEVESIDPAGRQALLKLKEQLKARLPKASSRRRALKKVG